MPVDPGDRLKVTFEVTLEDGTIAQNVHYFRAVLLTQLPNFDALVGIELWVEAAYAELTTDLPGSMTQNVCTVQKIEWSVSLGRWEVVELIGYFTPTITFGNLQEELPNQSSAFVTLNTGRPKSRGRKFVMPFGEDRQNQTYLISAAVTDMVNFADELLDNVVFDILEYFVPGIPRQAADVFLDFTAAVVTNVLGTQRRRRPGVGA